MEGFLCVISGPSGVGKGTIVKELMNERKDIELSISVTTRYRRQGEVHGKHYFFVSQEEFSRLEKEGKLLESAFVHGNRYGTPKDFVEEEISKGKIVILEIDVQGAAQIRESFDNAIYVFVLPPRMKDIEDRLRNRATEDEDKIKLRVINSIEEFKQITKYDYFLLNDKVDSATERLNKFLDEERKLRQS
ncbi:MAG: guanylate kinase [Tissierellia bacterium]|nr:guanylate kinase [Tissierellia bacterium]